MAGNCVEKAKDIPAGSTVLEFEGKFTRFDSMDAFLIGFHEDLINGEKFLMRGRKGGKFFMVVRSVQNSFEPEILPLTEDGARKARGLLPTCAVASDAFPGPRRPYICRA